MHSRKAIENFPRMDYWIRVAAAPRSSHGCCHDIQQSVPSKLPSMLLLYTRHGTISVGPILEYSITITGSLPLLLFDVEG